MKFGLPVLLAGVVAAVTPAAAQYSMRTGALGGSIGSRAISRPLGGTNPGFNGSGYGHSGYYGSGYYGSGYYGSGNRGTGRSPLYAGYPYAYSVWVPDYYDYVNSQNQYAAPYANGAPYGLAPDASSYYDAPPGAGPGPQQPVIINQYFSAPGPPQAANAPDAGLRGGNDAANAQAPGDPIGTPQNYYLIAYKNHAVYTAIAYWLEDKTLHYVTTQNTHNQASLDLIDLTLTKSLNQRNEVPFSMAAQ